MKYLDEYRSGKTTKKLLKEIGEITTREHSIMEVCGGQTHSLVKNGILDLLPKEITMLHGPGCPVCVTPGSVIDEAIYLAEKEGVILCTFGDMMRVPGNNGSLTLSKSKGADIRVLYSPLEAVNIALNNPEKDIVFFAVGFETTAPANALALVHARQRGLENFFILSSHVLVPPAIEAILADPENRVNGFLAAGHVCTIMGLEEYVPIAERYSVPIVATGFEPVDLVEGILMVVKQLEDGRSEVENQYTRMVKRTGNPKARELLDQVYTKGDKEWRGIGRIPSSGLFVNDEFKRFDAREHFEILVSQEIEGGSECIAGEILSGKKKPTECLLFGKTCTPENPVGAPMVSSEGACAAYYHHSDLIIND